MLPVPPGDARRTGRRDHRRRRDRAEAHRRAARGLRPAAARHLKERSTAYLTSWTEERGIDVTKPTTVNAALGGQMKRELRQQIMKRMVRNLPNLMPFMVGAAVGAVMNRRDTRKLADAHPQGPAQAARSPGTPCRAAAAGAARPDPWPWRSGQPRGTGARARTGPGARRRGGRVPAGAPTATAARAALQRRGQRLRLAGGQIHVRRRVRRVRDLDPQRRRACSCAAA